MAAERYRYKGQFISAVKAQRIANLTNAKKFLTTEFTYEAKQSSLRKGYLPSIEKQVHRALRSDRERAAERRVEREISPRERERRFREKMDRERELAHVFDIAREAAEIAESKDISILEAFDSIGESADDVDSFNYFTWTDVESYARDYLEEGESIFDFNVADLESAEWYHS